MNSTSPNAGHETLARWADLIDEGPSLQRLGIVTQNIGDLHERAESVVLVHLHGRLDRFHCADCDLPSQPDLSMASREPILRVTPSPCDSCGSDPRPSIVFFGEPLGGTDIDASMEAAQQANLTLVVGTSSVVYPTAILLGLATRARSLVVEVNPGPANPDCDLYWCTTAAIGLS